MTNEASSEPQEVVSPGHEEDPRSDIEQAVEARADALERGEGGSEGAMMTDPGEHSGNRGTGGEVRNQDLDAQ